MQRITNRKLWDSIAESQQQCTQQAANQPVSQVECCRCLFQRWLKASALTTMTVLKTIRMWTASWFGSIETYLLSVVCCRWNAALRNLNAGRRSTNGITMFSNSFCMANALQWLSVEGMVSGCKGSLSSVPGRVETSVLFNYVNLGLSLKQLKIYGSFCSVFRHHRQHPVKNNKTAGCVELDQN